MNEQCGKRPNPSDLVAFAEWETSIFDRPSAQSSQRLIDEVKRQEDRIEQLEREIFELRTDLKLATIEGKA